MATIKEALDTINTILKNNTNNTNTDYISEQASKHIHNIILTSNINDIKTGITSAASVNASKFNLNSNAILKQEIKADLSEESCEKLVKITGQKKEDLRDMSMNEVIDILLNEIQTLQKVESRVKHLEFMFQRLANKYPDFQEYLSEVECL